MCLKHQSLFRSGFVWSALHSALRRVGEHSAPRSKKSQSGVVKSLCAPEFLECAPSPAPKNSERIPLHSSPLCTNSVKHYKNLSLIHI